MHYHVTRNGETVSWAWVYEVKLWAQDLSRQLQHRSSRRKTDKYAWHACRDESCALYREWLGYVASTEPVTV